MAETNVFYSYNGRELKKRVQGSLVCSANSPMSWQKHNLSHGKYFEQPHESYVVVIE